MAQQELAERSVATNRKLLQAWGVDALARLAAAHPIYIARTRGTLAEVAAQSATGAVAVRLRHAHRMLAQSEGQMCGARSMQ